MWQIAASLVNIVLDVIFIPGIVSPPQIPAQKPITRKLMEPVEPTAARAAPPRVWPTIAVSATLYSCYLRFDFPTDAGCLEYLRGKAFQVERVPFAEKYFPEK